ncbi:unnamed protein product [Heterobilharzia americana]|nr:unnamed protein product [Heterobilharzia americana]
MLCVVFSSRILRPVGYHLFRTVANQSIARDAPGGTGSGSSSRPLDPIQQSFISRLREYRQKSEKSEVGLADVTPEELKEFSELLARVDSVFGAEGQDMTQFPTFKFEDPKLTLPSSSLNIPYPKDLEDAVGV